jgi:hypothetical protein
MLIIDICLEKCSNIFISTIAIETKIFIIHTRAAENVKTVP